MGIVEVDEGAGNFATPASMRGAAPLLMPRDVARNTRGTLLALGARVATDERT